MHMIIPFPNASNSQPNSLYRLQITIDGEFPDDDMPPPLFNPDEEQPEQAASSSSLVAPDIHCAYSV